ncbi:MAG: HAD-IA family hydrolase [Bacteroidaceae bacterium]|nr:HAD-IA family hydrolase [Bacteroidaceae bacterium]
MEVVKAVENYMKRVGCKSMRCKAALIDMDGVLYNSMPNHVEAWYRTIAPLGIDCTREEFFLWEGSTRTRTINLLFNRAYGHDAPEEVSRALYDEKVRQFRLLEAVEPMPGADAVIATLLSSDVRTVLVTGSSQGTLLECLDDDYPGAFNMPYRITGEDVKNGKPSPEPYLMGLQRVGVSAHEAIVIENAPLGVEAGVAAGVFTVAVNTGPIPPKALYDAGANLVFDSMAHFAEYLPQLISVINSTQI